jgi:pimeloyl-ACP methyl ester carboxylesterase
MRSNQEPFRRDLPGAAAFAGFASLGFILACAAQEPAPTPEKGSEPVAFPGRKSDYRGYVRYDFSTSGQSFVVVTPKSAAPGKPWIWRAEFFDHEPQVDTALLGQGWHLVHIPSAAGQYGGPKGVAAWSSAYEYLIAKHGFSPKPALEGLSRGGLLVFNWAAANPEKVSCLYADAPVCDFKSWPGGKGKSKGSAGDWQACLKAYNLTEAQALEYKLNPVDNLEPLAKARVPLLHVVGDADDVVPVAANTQIIEERYKKLGGTIEVIHKPGGGHHPHCLKDPAPIVAFILKYAPAAKP